MAEGHSPFLCLRQHITQAEHNCLLPHQMSVVWRTSQILCPGKLLSLQRASGERHEVPLLADFPGKMSCKLLGVACSHGYKVTLGQGLHDQGSRRGQLVSKALRDIPRIDRTSGR